MILQVFSHVGTTLKVQAAFQYLLNLYGNELYPQQKAAGSLGGAVNGGTIILHSNGYYERIR